MTGCAWRNLVMNQQQRYGEMIAVSSDNRTFKLG
jgi:hypothetical protein